MKNIDLDRFDFDHFEIETIEKLKEDEPYLSMDNLLSSLIDQIPESALDSEIWLHIEVNIVI